jgi:hypothetical protein
MVETPSANVLLKCDMAGDDTRLIQGKDLGLDPLQLLDIPVAVALEQRQSLGLGRCQYRYIGL